MPRWTTGKVIGKPSVPRDATIKLMAGNYYELYSPYNKRFVEELKSRVPKEQRKWDADKKRWILHRDTLELMRLILPDFYEYVREEQI